METEIKEIFWRENLTRELSAQAQKEIFKELDLFIDVDYLETYIDEAIGNAIAKCERKDD